MAADDPLVACARAIAEVAGAGIDESALLADGATEPPDGTNGSAPRRGRADAAALHRAHHDAALHRARTPREAIPRALFDALERERVEALGANRWAGVRANLDSLRALGDGAETLAPESGDAATSRSASAGPEASRSGAAFADAGDPAARAVRAVVELVRESLAVPEGRWSGASAAARADGERSSRGVAGVGRAAIDDIAERVRERTAELLPPLAASLDDQAEFAAHALALIERLGLAHAPGSNEGEAGEGAVEPGADVLGESDAETDAEGEALADEETASADGEATDEETDEPPAAGESEGEEAPDASMSEARDEPPVAGVDPRGGPAATDTGYRVWTRAFDEVVDARTLAEPHVLAARRAELDRHLERQGRLVRRLATRLQRVLLARQRREWQHDMDEGELDTRRLHRLVTDPLTPLVFKGEVDSAFRDTTVTLLIDNSRSMIGRPIMIAAACADLLARTFERCGVAVEVLGYTTVELHGGRSTAAWEAAGRPPAPGRLNDVRHIVYKSADMSYRSARLRLALMLERDVLKQNIDGEALLWAASRLMRRPTERRILIVISDGAPVDTTTLAANPRDYLDRHLDAVVADLERRGTIELAAIGIGHDVARFYSQAMSVFDARGLAPALLSRLESLFRQPR